MLRSYSAKINFLVTVCRFYHLLLCFSSDFISLKHVPFVFRLHLFLAFDFEFDIVNLNFLTCMTVEIKCVCGARMHLSSVSSNETYATVVIQPTARLRFLRKLRAIKHSNLYVCVTTTATKPRVHPNRQVGQHFLSETKGVV